MMGKTEEALSLTETGLACALRVREELPRAPSWAASSRCTALAFAGRVPEALELLDYFLSSPALAPEMRSSANMYRGRFLLLEGKTASAARALKDAAVALRADPSYGSWCLALLAEAEALLGHAAEAEAARDESLSLRGNDRLSVYVDERRALAWVDAQGGRLTDAIAELWAAADLALERGQRCFELIILDDLLRLGEPDAAPRARDVSDVVEGSLGEAVGLHAQAVVSTTWPGPGAGRFVVRPNGPLADRRQSFGRPHRRRIDVKGCWLDPPRRPNGHTRWRRCARGRDAAGDLA